MLATAKGKEHALMKLRERRKRNETREPIDNAKLYAGMPVYFDCDACGNPMAHAENYLTRQRLCEECVALKACGWLTE